MEHFLSMLHKFQHGCFEFVYRPIVLTTQGLCPSSGTVSSISGWVFTKFSTSSGSVVEELNLDPCTAQPPGLKTEKEKEKRENDTDR